MKRIETNKNKLLKFIVDFLDDNGYFPTVREMMSFLNVKSTSTVQYYLDKLEAENKIKKGSGKNKARAFEFFLSERPNDNYCQNYDTFTTIPLIGKITAGEPILAQQNYEQTFNFSDSLFGTDDLFMLSVQGNSMIEAGIFNGDKIVVHRQNQANNGEIVVALIDNSATVKKFYKENNHIRLQPENSTMKPIILNDVIILGKVVGLIRKFK